MHRVFHLSSLNVRHTKIFGNLLTSFFGKKVTVSVFGHGITFHDIRRTVKTHMLYAGVDKIYMDLIIGHSLKGMDVHYLIPSDASLKMAMGKYTLWLDKKIAETQNLLTKALTK